MEWRRRVTLMALVSAVGVAVVYLPQPLQTLQADEFGIAQADSAWPQIASQLGYAAGILFLLTASDRGDTRRQVSVQLVITALALVASAAAPGFLILCLATAAVGAATTVAPVLIADTLQLAPPESRSRSAAVLGGAFLVGTFTARSLAGGIADAIGWRPVLAGAAVVVLACVPLVRRAVDQRDPAGGDGYWRMLASIPRLAIRAPVLLFATAIQVCTFGAFVIMWGTLTLHAVAGSLGLSVLEAALIGLVGLAAGAVAVLLAGAVERIGTRRILIIAIAVEASGMAAVIVAPDALPVLLSALFAISLGAILAQIATQSRGLAAAGPGTAGRANTVYMVLAFGAGALWVALATGALTIGGYALVGGLGLVLLAIAAALWLIGRRATLV